MTFSHLSFFLNEANFSYFYFLIICFFLIHCESCFAYNKFGCPFYAGITGGYGSTTWSGLVPSEKHLNPAITFGAPICVTEGGAIWGVFGGYELIPCFAIEGSYIRFPNAKVSFDQDSLFAVATGHTNLNTHTETVALMGKIMLIIPYTDIRVYSSAGPAGVHRYDEINDHWRVGPSFGVGVNYNFTNHIMAELGANYVGGYGEAELNPAQDYFPFLYSVFLRLAYRFSIF